VTYFLLPIFYRIRLWSDAMISRAVVDVVVLFCFDMVLKSEYYSVFAIKNESCESWLVSAFSSDVYSFLVID